MITREQKDRIAEALDIDHYWWRRKFGDFFVDAPDLSTPEGIAKVKAALVERKVPYSIAFSPPDAFQGIVCGQYGKGDTEADALLTAVLRWLEKTND